MSRGAVRRTSTRHNVSPTHKRPPPTFQPGVDSTRRTANATKAHPGRVRRTSSMRKENSPNDFYVYKYLRAFADEYGPAGSPYYVGKGRQRRSTTAQTHACFVPKNRKNIVHVAEGLSESAAFSEERRFIKLYGRIDKMQYGLIASGCLENLSDGGDGVWGHIVKPAALKVMSERGKARANTPKGRLNLERATRLSAEHLASMSPQQKADHSAMLTASLLLRYGSMTPFEREMVSQRMSRTLKTRWDNTPRVTICPRGHLLTPENSYYNPGRKLAAQCRICRAAADREAQALLKEARHTRLAAIAPGTLTSAAINPSGFRGVYISPNGRTFRVAIRYKNKLHYGGSYPTPEAATVASDVLNIKLRGPGAFQNFPRALQK